MKHQSTRAIGGIAALITVSIAIALSGCSSSSEQQQNAQIPQQQNINPIPQGNQPTNLPPANPPQGQIPVQQGPSGIPLGGCFPTGGGSAIVPGTGTVRVFLPNGPGTGCDRRVNVQLGDVIEFSADLFDETTHTRKYVPAQSFQWTVVSAQNLVTTSTGAEFFISPSIANEITITATYRGAPAAGGFAPMGGMSDSVTLVVSSRFNPPTQLITAPNQSLQGANFNPGYALWGQGRWRYIAGQRYFVPDTYTVRDGNRDLGWAPYQNGRWTYIQNQNHGWTWVSYDRFGWLTDHYGIWRNHQNHGWIWMPFAGEQFFYRPHVASWFNQDQYVGWYPYYSGYAQGYRDGFSQGFRDGFWDGYNAAQTLYARNSQMWGAWGGFTMVHTGYFANSEWFKYRINQSATMWPVVNFCSTNERFAPWPYSMQNQQLMIGNFANAYNRNQYFSGMHSSFAQASLNLNLGASFGASFGNWGNWFSAGAGFNLNLNLNYWNQRQMIFAPTPIWSQIPVHYQTFAQAPMSGCCSIGIECCRTTRTEYRVRYNSTQIEIYPPAGSGPTEPPRPYEPPPYKPPVHPHHHGTVKPEVPTAPPLVSEVPADPLNPTVSGGGTPPTRPPGGTPIGTPTADGNHKKGSPAHKKR